jgi:hypothetical protein
MITFTRATVASILASSRIDATSHAKLRQLVREGQLTWKRNYTDTSYRGNGNRSWRRAGNDIDTSCGCVICVEYGGDCANVMRREGRAEYHRSQRGVKTRSTN